MPENWRAAYFRQAQSDYEVMLLLMRRQVPICHQLHYLQMTTEKLAKGYLSTPEQRPPQVHDALVRFLQVVKNTPALHHLCDCRPQQVREYVNSLLPLAEGIEELALAGGRDRVNPEYPWSDGATVRVPIDYSFPDLDLKKPRMRKMMILLERCYQMVGEELSQLT